MGIVKKTEYANYKDVVKYLEGLLSFTATVDETAVVANAEGRKILPAGTIVTGSLEDRSVKVKKANDASAIGVTRYDVDVENNNPTVTVVFAGAINLANLPEAPAAAAKTAMPNLVFMN